MTEPTTRAVALVSPTERPGDRARSLWRTNAILLWTVVAAVLAAFAYYVDWSPPVQVLAIVLGVFAVLDVTIAPEIRFRVHRYQVGELSVINRSGWLITQHRIAPLSRVQTVDVQRGPTAHLFGLATLAISTASSAGAIRIVALEADVAARLAEDLVRRADLDDTADGT